MKLLILGESGSMGAGLATADLTWGEILHRGIESRTGEAPEIVHVRYYTYVRGWQEHLERAIAQGPFDVVILSPTKFAFTVFSADNRIRQLLGKRAGDWFKSQADSFDTRTRQPGSEGARRKFNRLAHRSARRIIGQASLSDVETITETYVWTMARLARLEDTQVIVFGSSSASTLLARRHPEIHERTARFRSALKSEAQRRRFDWIERDALWREQDGDRDGMFSDGLHKTPELQARLADAILEVIRFETKAAHSPR